MPSTQKPQRQETDQNLHPEVQVPHLDCASINCNKSWVSPLLGHISALYTDGGNLIKERDYQMLLRKCKYKEPGVLSKFERTIPDHVSWEKKWVKMLTSKTWPHDRNSQFLHFHPGALLHFTNPLYFASSSYKHCVQWKETQRYKRQRRDDLMHHSCMEQTTYCAFFLFVSIFVATTERVDFQLVFQPA